MTKRRRNVYLTLDLESDYATNQFLCLDRVLQLVQFTKMYCVPLTVFVEGRVLRDHRHVLDHFPDTTVFALHCNDHRQIPDSADSLREGIEAFRVAFGYNPRGYRAGNYKLTEEIMNSLTWASFAWDASYVPRWSSQACKGELPFRWHNGLWELPVGVWPDTGIRFAMSMVSLIGLPITEMLTKLKGLPRLPVFVFHLHDIFPSPSLRLARAARQLGHAWNYRMGFIDPFVRFRQFVEFLVADGCEFKTCEDLFLEICQQDTMI